MTNARYRVLYDESAMVTRNDLVLRFLARAGKDVGEAPQLGPVLARALAEARHAWPAIELPDEELVDALAARLPQGEDAAAALQRLKVADLYLACAASRGYPEAVAVFEDTIIRRVGHFVGGINNTPAFISDVAQALRIKL